MVDTPQTPDEKAAPAEPAPTTVATPRRGMGRGDMRDTVAEMTERAQQLSLEAGSKIAGAMREVIYAAAGLAGFTVESARDLVQYMVRRGQMTQEEGEKLIREAEEGSAKRGPAAPPAPPAPRGAPTVAAAPAPSVVSAPVRPTPVAAPAAKKAPAVVAPAKDVKPAARVAKPAAKKAPAAPRAAAAKRPAVKAAARPASKAAAKPAAKKSATKRKR